MLLFGAIPWIQAPLRLDFLSPYPSREITARFDEAPNIVWGRELEQAGAHVAYGVERLKTHIKLALVVREEAEGLRRYIHVGTGNYHTGTARLYEDLGLLTADPDLAADAAAPFNKLTGGIPSPDHGRLMVAPHSLRERFIDLIRREADHARAGRPCGIRAKMNQLQDNQIIRALYEARQAGVPMSLNVRGLCCLRADPAIQAEVDKILRVYEDDNCSAWDMQPDGRYVRRRPAQGEDCRGAQQVFIDRSHASP